MACRWLAFLLGTVMGEGALVSVLVKGTNLIMRAPPSLPSHLPKAPPLNTITLGVGASIPEFGGDIQSITPCLKSMTQTVSLGIFRGRKRIIMFLKVKN